MLRLVGSTARVLIVAILILSSMLVVAPFHVNAQSFTIDNLFIGNALQSVQQAEPGYITINDCTHWISYFLETTYGMPKPQVPLAEVHTDALIKYLIADGDAKVLTGNQTFEGGFISPDVARTDYFSPYSSFANFLDSQLLEDGGSQEFIIAYKWNTDNYPGGELASHLAIYVGPTQQDTNYGHVVSHGTGSDISNEWDKVPQRWDAFTLSGGIKSIAIIALTNTHSGTQPPAFPPVSMGPIQGSFFANSSEFNGTFDVAPGTTPLFTEQFPVINFNPPYDQNPSIACGSSTAVNELSRPFEDVVQFQDGSCGEQIVQGNGYQAGVDTLTSFEAVFTAQLSVSQPGQLTFNLFSDDGWVLSVGPNGASQPTYVSGSMGNPPAKGPFTGYPVVGSFNTNSPPVQNTVTVNFPAAGTYPMELDYVECCQGELSLVMGTSFGNPIPPRIPPAPPCSQQLGQHCTAIWMDRHYYNVGDSGQVCYTVPQASYIVLTLYLPDGSSQQVYRASDDGTGACLPATIIAPMGDHRMHLDVYTDRSHSTRIGQADVSYAVGTIVAIVAAAAASGTPTPGTPQPSTPTPTDSTPSPGIIIATLTPTATPVPPTSTPVPATQVPTTTSNPPAATNTPSSTATRSASPAAGQGTPSTPVATDTQTVQTATSTTRGTSAATATATAGPGQPIPNNVAMPTATSTSTARQPVTHRRPTRSGTHSSGPALRVSMLPLLVRPGAPERIAVSYLEGSLVQASVTFPGERPVSLVNMTDSHGHLTLTVPVPRNVRLRNGRASAPVSVRAVAGPWRRLTVRTVSVRPGGIQRITVSTVPRTLVRALVTFSRHQSLSLFGLTDNRGRMSLVVRVPRTIKLQNGQARAQVAVWTVNARRQAQATALLTISDMVVSVVSSRISRCQQTDAVQVAFYPNVPLRLQLLFAKGHPLTLTAWTDRHGHTAMRVQLHYVKVTGTVHIGVLVSDARPRSHRTERTLLSVSVPRTCQRQ